MRSTPTATAASSTRSAGWRTSRPGACASSGTPRPGSARTTCASSACSASMPPMARARSPDRLRLSNGETRELVTLGLLLEALHGSELEPAALRVLAYRHGREQVRQALSITLARRGEDAGAWPQALAALEGPVPALPFTGA